MVLELNALKELYYEVLQQNVKAGPPIGSAEELALSFVMFVTDESNAEKLRVPIVMERLASQQSYGQFVHQIGVYDKACAKALWPEVCRLTAPYVERLRQNC